MSRDQGQSYGRIIKSSTLLGGASLINVLLGMVRVKILAVQLGPALFGVISLYNSLLTMVGTLTSLGLGGSAVREIAEAAGRSDEQRVARTIAILRRMVWFTGVVGMAAVLAIAWPASWWTFSDHSHAWAIAVLGITVLFSHLQAGQSAVLSGLRRIREMAAVNVVGGLLSTLLAIPLLLLFRENGIVPFLIAVAAGQLAVNWWYASKIKVPSIQVTWRECAAESREMVRLGSTLVVSGIAMEFSYYLIRLTLQLQIGDAAVGLYQSAYTVSAIYVGFILQAMAGDYFPRLAGAGEDRVLRNRLVSEQAEMALLFAVPGLVLALVLSEWMILLLYSESFVGASDIMRWQILGMLGRIVTWPLGFILLARTDKRAYIVCELSAAAVHVLFVWLAVRCYGTVGAGIGFAGQYLFYFFLIIVLVRTRHGYVWHSRLQALVLSGASLVALAFGSTFIDSLQWRYGFGAVVALIAVTWTLFGLIKCLGRDRVEKAWRDLKAWIGLIG